jgi:hypothetical protein
VVVRAVGAARGHVSQDTAWRLDRRVSEGCGSGDAPAERRILGDVFSSAGQGRQTVALYINPTADFSAWVCRSIRDHLAREQVVADRLPGAGCALAERLSRRSDACRPRFEVVDSRAPARCASRPRSPRARRGQRLDLTGAQIAATTGNVGADILAFLRGALELEVVDAVTGERLAAAIDDRLVAAPGEEAGDRLASDTVAWRDVEAFLDSRARRLAARLSALHQRRSQPTTGRASGR